MRLGRVLVTVGAGLTAVALVVGLSLLARQRIEHALDVLALAPIGMLMAFSGLVGALLGGAPGPQRGPEDD